MKNQDKKTRDKGLHIGLALLALVISIGLWIYAVVVNDPDSSTDLQNVPVTYTGEDGVFKSLSMILTSNRNRGVDLTLHGRMSDLANLTRESVTVTVDLSAIEEPGEYELPYEVKLPTTASGQAVSVTKRTAHVKVVADKLSTKPVEIRLKDEIAAEDGYMRKPKVLTPAMLTVTGPSEIVERISYASVELKTTQKISSTLELSLPYKLCDAKGNEIISEHVTADVSEIRAEFPVFRTKKVPVTLDFKDGGGLIEEEHIRVKIEPSEITVAGDDELDLYNKCVLDTIFLADLMESGVRTYETAPLINGVELVGDMPVFTVTIDIHGVETVQRTVAPLAQYTPPAGYRLVIHTTALYVTLRGSPEALAAVTSSNLKAVIDVTSDTALVPETIYSLSVTVTVPTDIAVGVIGEYEVAVELVPIGEE